MHTFLHMLTGMQQIPSCWEYSDIHPYIPPWSLSTMTNTDSWIIQF